MENKPTYEQLEAELALIKEKYSKLSVLEPKEDSLSCLTLANYQYLANKSNDYISIVDKDLIIKYLNISNQEINLDEVIGRSIFDFIPFKDQEKNRKRYESVFKTKERLAYTAEFSGLDGQNHFVDVELYPKMKGSEVIGVIAVTKDVTEKIQVAQNLKQSEKKYRSLFENNLIAHIEQDYTKGIALIQQLKDKGVEDLCAYLDANPDFMAEILKSLPVLKSNIAALSLWKAKDNNHLNERFSSSFSANFLSQIKQVICAVFEGETEIVKEVTFQNFKQETIHGIFQINVVTDELNKAIIANISVVDITSRVKVEKELQDTERDFQRVFNEASDAIYIIGKDGSFIEVNQGAVEMYGHEKSFFSGKTPAHLSAPGKNDLEKTKELIKLAFTGVPQSFDFWGIRKNGEIFPKIVRAKAGTFKGKEVVIAFAIDISERHKAQLEIIKNEAFNKAITQNAAEGIVTLDANGVVMFWNHAAEKIFGYSEEQMIGSDLGKLSPLRYLERNENLLNFIKLHSHSNESTTVEISGVKKDGTEFPVSVSLSSWEVSGDRYYTGVVVDITETKEAQTKLVESADLLKDSQQIAKLGNWWMTYPEDVLTWSAETYQIFEIDPSKQEVDFDLFCSFLTEQDLFKIQEEFQLSIKSGNDYVFEHIIRLKNGKKKWVIERGRPIYNDSGECTKMIGTVQDITERKKIEDSIRVKEQKYRTLFENNPVALLEQDFSFAYKELQKVKKEGVKNIEKYLLENNDLVLKWANKNEFIDVNKAAVKLFKAKNKTDLIANFDKVFFTKSFSHLVLVASKIFEKKEEIIDESLVVQDFNGNEINGLAKLNLVYSKNRLKVTASIIDMTSRVSAEKALKISEENFKNLSDLSFEGIVIHKNGIVVTVNEAFLKLCEYSKEELIGKNIIKIFLKKEYHPIIKERIKQNITSPYEVEAVGKNGVEVYLELEAREIHSGIYKGCRVTAVRNITERKATLHHNKLLSTAVDQSSNTVVITKPNGKIEYVNPRFTEVTGYSFEESIGKNPRILNSGYQSKDYYKHMWQTISSGKSWEGEFKNISKSKEIFWERVRISPITNDQGVIVNHVAIKENITEQKNNEMILERSRKKIESSEKKFRSLFEMSGDAALIIKNGIFRECNQAALGLLGYTSLNEIISKHPSALSPETQPGGESSYDLSNKMMNDCLANGTNRFEWVHVRRNGEAFPTEVLLTTISNKPGKTVIHAVWRDITLQKQASKSLSLQNEELQRMHRTVELKNDLLTKSKVRYQNVIEQSPVSLWQENYGQLISLLKERATKITNMREYIDTHPEFVNECVSKIELVNVNETAVKLFGKKSKLELMRDLAGTFNAVSFETFKDELEALANGEREFSAETQYIGANNEIIYAIIKMVIIDDDFNCIVSIIDISEIKKAEIEMQKAKDLAEEKEASFRSLFSSIRDGIVVGDTNRVIKDCNPALEQMFGFTLGELKGERSSILYANEDEFNELTESISVLKDTRGPVYKTVNYKKKNGEIFPGETSIYHLRNDKNEVSGLIGLVRDVTNKQAREELIKQQNEQLQIQMEKAEESNRLKTEFLNNMSHEIRTPMNGILGFTQFLNDSDISDEKRNYYVSIIENSGAQLLHVIDDILEISKLGTKQVKVIENEVNINSTLLELFSIFDVKAKEKQIPLYYKKGLEDKNSIVLTDKTKLNKILGNLLENALKFTNKGFIEFGYSVMGANIEFFVRDTGIGIAEDKQEIIFERFSQAEKGLSRKVGGLGLGLSIAKENSELLGGNIRVDSEYGKGTTFYVSIPFKQTKSTKTKITPLKSSLEELSQFTILVAEDEEINYLYIEILLGNIKDYKFNILHAKNGKEAVDICKNEEYVHLVLMDLKMPIMDGFEATRKIKSFMPKLPIIAQTAYSTATEKQIALDAGCDDFISKPIEKEVFNKVIRKFIAQL